MDLVARARTLLAVAVSAGSVHAQRSVSDGLRSHGLPVSAAVPDAEAPSASRSDAGMSRAQIPLVFVPNTGQVNPQVSYYGQTSAGVLLHAERSRVRHESSGCRVRATPRPPACVRGGESHGRRGGDRAWRRNGQPALRGSGCRVAYGAGDVLRHSLSRSLARDRSGLSQCRRPAQV